MGKENVTHIHIWMVFCAKKMKLRQLQNVFYLYLSIFTKYMVVENILSEVAKA